MIPAIGTALSWFAGSRAGQILLAAGGAILLLMGLRAGWKNEGRSEARNEGLARDTAILEKQRDAHRPDPHDPDSVLDRL